MRRSIRPARSSLITLASSAYLALACAFLALDAAAQQESEKKSKLVVPSTIYDFGTVQAGAKVAHAFELRNEGNADLGIQRVVTSCGCTAAKLPDDEIEAGQSEKLNVELDTTGMSGPKEKIIRVYTSDLDNPFVSLTLKGTVKPLISVEPEMISFGEIERSRLAESARELSVKAGSAGKKVQNVGAFSPFLMVEEAGNDTYRVKLSPKLAPGEFRDRLIVNLSDGSAVNVPVHARVVGDLSLSPPALSFGLIEGKEPIKRSVTLKAAEGKAVNITKLTSDSPAIKAEYKAVVPGREYQIDVEVEPSAIQKDLRAKVEIVTDKQGEEPLQLNVFGILPPRV